MVGIIRRISYIRFHNRITGNDYGQYTIKKKIEEQGQESGDGDSEGISTETFLALCYKCKLTRLDLEDMTIGMCLDYIDEYIEINNPKSKKKAKPRKAKQTDFDSF